MRQDWNHAALDGGAGGGLLGGGDGPAMSRSTPGERQGFQFRGCTIAGMKTGNCEHPKPNPSHHSRPLRLLHRLNGNAPSRVEFVHGLIPTDLARRLGSPMRPGRPSASSSIIEAAPLPKATASFSVFERRSPRYLPSESLMRRFDLAGKLDGGLMISLVASTSRFGFVLLPGKRTSRQAKMLTQKLHIAKKTNRSEDMMCSEVESLQRPCCLIFHRASSQPGDNHSTCAVARGGRKNSG